MNERIQSITFAAGTLTDAQRDGLACVVCSVSYLTSTAPSVPVGTVDGAQVFACEAHTAAAGKSSTWPDGEAESVRETADDIEALRDLAERIGEVAEDLSSCPDRAELVIALREIRTGLSRLREAVEAGAREKAPELLDQGLATAQETVRVAIALLDATQAKHAE
ncbi:hypothetical protein [Actinomadura xylanilytica]|uniref:hypothetical protein n=1 Tax=Actinomadura xylanilytica TaxID=887459 RepID=UPI00255B3D20|nr:hypothetical protein [Actinomadura xylanilytica]MDL4772910.1 hypothetical protein [Actinomadura xylanilytica]